jgi:hypothetical protein
MKKIVFAGMIILTACGGSLSDEQRKKMREGMERQKIVKLSDSEIMLTAMDKGQKVYAILEKFHFDSTKVDSIAEQNHVKIRWVVPGAATAQAVEQQLIEAYVVGLATGSLQDNIQKLHAPNNPDTYDTLIYSKPVVSSMPDGVENLEGVWNIYLSKKDVVLSAGK